MVRPAGESQGNLLPAEDVRCAVNRQAHASVLVATATNDSPGSLLVDQEEAPTEVLPGSAAGPHPPAEPLALARYAERMAADAPQHPAESRRKPAHPVTPAEPPTQTIIGLPARASGLVRSAPGGRAGRYDERCHARRRPGKRRAPAGARANRPGAGGRPAASVSGGTSATADGVDAAVRFAFSGTGRNHAPVHEPARPAARRRRDQRASTLTLRTRRGTGRVVQPGRAG